MEDPGGSNACLFRLFQVPEEQMLVEALRTAPTGCLQLGQKFAALCGLRKALAATQPPIQGVLRCGGAELLVEALRDTKSLSSAGQAEAAWCLVQLASGSSSQTKQLVQAGQAAKCLGERWGAVHCIELRRNEEDRWGQE
eukprot:Skav227197  [mRNA]  locus=scaffold2048:204737:207033:- [translate_table: standard]